MDEFVKALEDEVKMMEEEISAEFQREVNLYLYGTEWPSSRWPRVELMGLKALL